MGYVFFNHTLVPDVVKKQLTDFHENGRFKETEENQAIFMVKERAIEVIDLLFNFRFYIRLQVGHMTHMISVLFNICQGRVVLLHVHVCMFPLPEVHI